MGEIKQEREKVEQKPKQISGDNGSLLFVAVLFIILLIVLFFSLNNRIGGKLKKNNDNPAAQVYSNNSSGAGNQGDNLTQTNGDSSNGVEVTAVYEKDKSQKQIFFKLYFNTHVIDYSSYDFQENIVIKDSQGKVYNASNITKEGTGHHQSIEIIFLSLPFPFKLVVKNLAGVAVREFNW